MAKSLSWFVNGLDLLLSQSIKNMTGFTQGYLREMGSVKDVEALFKDLDVNKMSIDDIKEKVLKEIGGMNKVQKLGKLPVKCKDKKVRFYDPEWWAETIARTRSRGLQEEGMYETMIESGFDLVIVSIGGSGDACKNWEGKILSISGQTPDFPTVQEAQDSGEIFHPRCVHSTSPLLITKQGDGSLRIWGRDSLPSQAIKQLSELGRVDIIEAVSS